MVDEILLIEADVVLGAVMVEVLRHDGHEVVFLQTLKGEVDRLRTRAISAVILDIDTTPLERELPPLSMLKPSSGLLPIVLMGMEASKNLPQRLRPYLGRQQVKHLTWVQKPFRNEELLDAVRQAQASNLSEATNGV